MAPRFDNDPNSRYIPEDLRDFILRRDGYRCQYCGTSLRFVEWHADHVWPYSYGGLTVPENLVAACEPCNLAKSDKLGIYPKPRDYWHLHKLAGAVRFPFFSVLVSLVGLFGIFLSIEYLSNIAVTSLAAGAVVAGIMGVYGWQNGRSL